MKENKRKVRERKVKAYILSRVHGTIQIGHTVYCVPTREKFSASMKGLKDYPYLYVTESGWKGAKEALRLWNSGTLEFWEK